MQDFRRTHRMRRAAARLAAGAASCAVLALAGGPPAAAQVIVPQPGVTVDLGVLEQLGPPETLPGLLSPSAAPTMGGHGDGNLLLKPEPAQSPRSRLHVAQPTAKPSSPSPAKPAAVPAKPDVRSAAKTIAQPTAKPSSPAPRVVASPPPPRPAPPKEPEGQAKAAAPDAVPVVASSVDEVALPAAPTPAPTVMPAAPTTASRPETITDVSAAMAPPPAAPAAPAEQAAPAEPEAKPVAEQRPAAPPPAPELPPPAPEPPQRAEQPPRLAQQPPAKPQPPANTAAPEPAPAPAPAESVAALPTLQGSGASIAFADQDAALPAGAAGTLNGIAARLSEAPDAQAQILAYASAPDGNASRARRLSLARALATRSYLIERGVQATRIEVRALGNQSEAGSVDRVDVRLVTP